VDKSDIGIYSNQDFRKESKFKTTLYIIFSAVLMIEILAILTKVTFISTIADFIFTSLFYLGICFGIWVLICKKKVVIKVIGIILAILIFSVNYLSSTIGALGVGFVLNDWTPRQEIQIDKNIEYKEIPLGMATDDYRGKRVEIYKQIGFLPFERKIIEKVYINEAPGFIYKLDVKYNKTTNELYLYGAETHGNKKIENWNDTIRIK